MAFPELPFADYTWRISHHQGVLTSHFLHTLLWAASTYQDSRDPAQEITNYLVANDIVPANVRRDSQQADIWRDYQQVLSELGLMYSTRRQSAAIQLTQAGIAYLDGAVTFTDLMTTQAMRFQYPNGHHTQKSPGDPSPFNFAEQQEEAGVMIRPAQILWLLLYELALAGSTEPLSPIEIEHFAIPTLALEKIARTVEHLILFRDQPTRFRVTKRRRNASDWIKRLSQTVLFVEKEGGLGLSPYSMSRSSDVRTWIYKQVAGDYWRYPKNGAAQESWANWYGTLNSDFMLDITDASDYGVEEEPDDETNISRPDHTTATPFVFTPLPRVDGGAESSLYISSVYTAALSNSAHRQHDAMLRLIAETCRRKNAEVFSDPSTFDLLIKHEGVELLIEVKSASLRNLHRKIRLAVGQVSYYDFLRSTETTAQRRKVVALTLGLSEDHWAKSFLSGFMDIDLITLQNGRLRTTSKSSQVSGLLS